MPPYTNVYTFIYTNVKSAAPNARPRGRFEFEEPCRLHFRQFPHGGVKLGMHLQELVQSRLGKIHDGPPQLKGYAQPGRRKKPPAGKQRAQNLALFDTVSKTLLMYYIKLFRNINLL